jgi:hypothetical protein
MDILPVYGTVALMHCILKEMVTGEKSLTKNKILVDI